MAIVGSAHVVIRAITDKLESDISSALSGVGKNSSTQGNSAGKNFGDSFSRSVSESINTDGAVDRITEHVSDEMGSAGRDAGSAFSRGVGDGINRDLPAAEGAAGGAGGRIGNAFSSGFGRSGASRHMTSMILRIAALTPIIAAVVAALSTLVTGLFAVAAAAGQAAASLVVLPAVLGAIIGGIGTAVIAFGGIGKAVQAGLKPASQTAKQTAETQLNLSRQLRNAEEGLADAIYNSRQQIESARDAVIQADRNVVASHAAVKQAEEALRDARRAAKEELIDLAFAAEGGALAEERAAIALEKARASLGFARKLPEDHVGRREAELAYKEADLNLRQIKERNGDIAQEQRKAKREGVSGNDAVVAAQERLKAAHEGVREAIEQQREAQQRLNRIQVTSARSIRDAQEALADARGEMEQFAATGSAGGVDQFAEAMKGLTPEARSFVRFIIEMKDEFKSLRDEAGREMFPKLEESLGRLITNFFPSLRVALRESGSAMGDAANRISKAMSRGPFTDAFQSVASNNADVVRRMGRVFANLAVALVNVWDAAEPLINQFSRWMVDWSRDVRIFSVTKNRTGEMSESFEKAGDRMRQLIRITKNIVEGTRDFGRVAAPEGERLLDVFEKATEKFANFTDSKKNRKELRAFFEDVGRNFQALSSLIGVVGGAFARLGAVEGVQTTSVALEETTIKLEELLGKSLDRLGPQLVELLDAVIEAFTALQESGAVEIAIDILTGFFNIVSDIMNSPMGPFIGTLLGFGAALKTIQVIRGFPGIKLLDKTVVGLGKSIGNLKVNKAGATISQTLKANLGAARIVAVGTAKNIGSGIVGGVKAGASKIGSAAKDIGGKLATHIGKAPGAVKDVGGKIASGISGGLGRAGKAVGDFAGKLRRLSAVQKIAAGAAAAFNAVMALNPIVLIVVAIVALIAGFVLLYRHSERFREIVDAVFGAVVNIVSNAVAWIRENWELLVTILLGPFGILVRLIVRHWDQIREGVRNVISWIGERFRGLIDFFRKLPGRIGNAAGDMFSWLRERARDAHQWVIDRIVDVIVFFRRLPGRLGDAAGDLFGWLRERAQAVGRWIGERVDDIVGFFRRLGDRIGDLPNPFAFLRDMFMGVLRGLQELWNRLDLSVDIQIPDWVPRFGGRKFTVPDLFPDINVFARGGIVPATPGGVLGVLAEVGKNERVEPLDPNGLSARDKALFKFMMGEMGGGSGQAFHVYPSQGMDETELAYKVAREVRWNRTPGA